MVLREIKAEFEPEINVKDYVQMAKRGGKK